MYLLTYRMGQHLFSFYINSAKKKIVIGGEEGDILLPPEMRGYEITLRKEFNFEKKEYVWALFPTSGGFTCNNKAVEDGMIFEDSDVITILDYSFSFSHHSHLGIAQSYTKKGVAAGNTLVLEEEITEYKRILFEYEGKTKSFLFRDSREIRIGRKNTDVVLNYPEVSSEHILLIMRKDGINFWNKGKNGTAINGVKVENGELKEGKYHFLIAGKHKIDVTILKEKSVESFYKGSLVPYFEKMENWINQPELFSSHPIILISGESGSGKEVFAEFAHSTSNRKGEFVTFNAAAIPENLAESELFGTRKGGFTGAEEREGAFLLADNGTLFLDEIAEMPMNLQSKLLRVLEDWTVRRVGETGQGKKVNVMVLLATNKNLQEAVDNGTFRKDLYFRLSTLHINIPPLRERKNDIIPLGKHLHFMLKGSDVTFTEDAEKAMRKYDWPGNVRELKSVMTKFAYMNKTTFEAEDFDN